MVMSRAALDNVFHALADSTRRSIVQQLTNFKTGARTNDRAHVMRSIAAHLSEDDMRAVAEYVAGR